MIDDAFVINAAVHPYNLDESNVAGPGGAIMREMLYGLHATWNPVGLQVSREMFQADQPVEALMATNFAESDVDIVVNHTLRLDSMFLDGLCSRQKNIELQQRWPQRVISYVGVDPTDGVAVCVRELEEQVSEMPAAVGLKVYPDQVEPYLTYRMDDPEIMFPLYQKCVDLGLRSVAVHKALPNGPVPLNPYRVEDLDGAAIAFPQLNFEIIHGGMAFVEETAQAIARFPNVFVNLEITSLLLHKAPAMFEEVLATLLFWGGPSKLLYADGALFCHPQALIEKLWAMKLPDRLLEKFGLEQLTVEDKKGILGLNYAKVVGLDVPAATASMAGDEWDRRVSQAPRPAPYESWRNLVGTRP